MSSYTYDDEESTRARKVAEPSFDSNSEPAEFFVVHVISYVTHGIVAFAAVVLAIVLAATSGVPDTCPDS